MSPSRLEITTRADLDPWRVEWHAEIGTTMDRAAELAGGGAPEGIVVVADFQRDGRGTRGRTWVAPPGACLMFTFLLRPAVPAEELAGLPRTIAHLAAETVAHETGLTVEVKAPNDLVIGGRKLGGVLCVSHVVAGEARWVACGIGVNTSLERPDPSIANATSMTIEGAPPVSHRDLLERLLGAFDVLRRPAPGPAAVARFRT